MKRIRDVLLSDKGMKIVNALFFISLLFSGHGLIFIAYIVWIIYLLFCFKHSKDKSGKIIYGIFIGLASAMILQNLYFALR